MARSMEKAKTQKEENLAVVEPVEEVVSVPVPKKKKFAADEEVMCRAVLTGRTFMRGKRTGILYGFLGKDDEIGIEYQDLAAEVREGTNLIFHPMIVIEDEDFINEFPKLGAFYQSLYPTTELENILRKPAAEIKALLPTLPPGIQKSLQGTAAKMVRTGELDSVSVIKTLDEYWGTQLSLLTGFFDEA